MDISSLINKSCQACTEKTVPLSEDKVALYLTLLPHWRLVDKKLKREIKVKNFSEALTWANQIAPIAEQENHHPDLIITWGRLGITIFTHSINNLSENDFILAAKIESIID